MNMLGNYVGQDGAQSSTVSWRSCRICDGEQFKSPKDFASHLKMVHCRKEGGSYICTYGPNSLCKTLPLEGVCSKDYDTHILRFHVAIMGQVSFEVPSLTSSEASLASSANRQASNSSLQDMSKVTDSSSGTGTHQQTEGNNFWLKSMSELAMTRFTSLLSDQEVSVLCYDHLNFIRLLLYQ